MGTTSSPSPQVAWAAMWATVKRVIPTKHATLAYQAFSSTILQLSMPSIKQSSVWSVNPAYQIVSNVRIWCRASNANKVITRQIFHVRSARNLIAKPAINPGVRLVFWEAFLTPPPMVTLRPVIANYVLMLYKTVLHANWWTHPSRAPFVLQVIFSTPTP
jgi:hypothetical protein